MLQELLRQIKESNNRSERSQAVLSLLAIGNTIPCPKLLWMLPEEMKDGKLRRFLKNPIKHKWKVFFICEKTFQLANPNSPMILELDRQWLRNLAFLFKASVVALKIAGEITAFAGFPLGGIANTLAGTISECNKMFLGVMRDFELGAFSDAKEELKTYEEMDRSQFDNDKTVARMMCLTGQAFRFFSEVALKSENKKNWEPYMTVEVVQDKVVWVAKERRKNPLPGG